MRPPKHSPTVCRGVPSVLSNVQELGVLPSSGVKKKSMAAGIAGGVVGGVALLSVAATLGLRYRKRRMRRMRSHDGGGSCAKERSAAKVLSSGLFCALAFRFLQFPLTAPCQMRALLDIMAMSAFWYGYVHK